MTELERLQAENEYLRAENAVLKSWENSDWRRKRERRKTEIVQELITEFSLDILLKSVKLARSTYYYHLKQLDKPDKDDQGLKLKSNLFYWTQGKLWLSSDTFRIKKSWFWSIIRGFSGWWMSLNLQARIRQKRKYSSHKGDIGKKADNLIQRQFEASKPMEKCYTDVTEFAIPASTQKPLLITSFRWF